MGPGGSRGKSREVVSEAKKTLFSYVFAGPESRGKSMEVGGIVFFDGGGQPFNGHVKPYVSVARSGTKNKEN